MGVQRSSSGFRIFLLFLGAVAFFTYYSRPSSEPPLQMDKGTPNPIPGLDVSLEQTGTSPPTVTVKVTNKNTDPVTILTYGSPLDGLALQLGLLSIYPEGASEPLDISVVQVRRKWPPDLESLITVDAGQSQQHEIILREPIVDMDALGEKAKVQLSGKWKAVWTKKRADVTRENLENLGSNSEAHTGSFESNTLEVTIA